MRAVLSTGFLIFLGVYTRDESAFWMRVEGSRPDPGSGDRGDKHRGSAPRNSGEETLLLLLRMLWDFQFFPFCLKDMGSVKGFVFPHYCNKPVDSQATGLAHGDPVSCSCSFWGTVLQKWSGCYQQILYDLYAVWSDSYRKATFKKGLLPGGWDIPLGFRRSEFNSLICIRPSKMHLLTGEIIGCSGQVCFAQKIPPGPEKPIPSGRFAKLMCVSNQKNMLGVTASYQTQFSEQTRVQTCLPANQTKCAIVFFCWDFMERAINCGSD